jgi:hypothetical protein
MTVRHSVSRKGIGRIFLELNHASTRDNIHASSTFINVSTRWGMSCWLQYFDHPQGKAHLQPIE